MAVEILPSLSRWMTDLKRFAAFGQLLISSVVLPGAHHAGLTSIIPDPNYTAALAYALFNGNMTIINAVPAWVVAEIAEDLAVTQILSFAAELALGCRYLDVRIAAYSGAPSQVYLSHLFMSTVSLASVLTDANNFMRANPQEILILDITNNYTPGG